MTLEHAIALHMLLPWFKVAYYGVSDLVDLRKKFPPDKYPNLDLSRYKMGTKQLDIMRAAFAKGTLRYVISTTVFKQGVNFTKLQVLIRAEGTTSAIDGIQIPGRLARLADGKDASYLIDIEDSFCTWAERRAGARIALYNKQGWTNITEQEVIDDLRAGSEKDPTHVDRTTLPEDRES